MKKVYVVFFAGLLMLLASVALFQQNLGDGVFRPALTSEERSDPQAEPAEGNSLPFEVVPFRGISEDAFPPAVSTEPLFDVFTSDNPAGERFAFFIREQAYSFFAVPKELRREVSFERVYLDSRVISIHYRTGNPRIPRVVGHQQLFDVDVLEIPTLSMVTTTYTIRFINAEGKITQETPLDFVAPVRRTRMGVSGLSWVDESTLAFASFYDQNWDVWTFNVEKETPPVRLTNRHRDIPLNKWPSLGALNINMPRPFFNRRSERIIYHAEHDIWEIKPNGHRGRALTTAGEVFPFRDGYRLADNDPKPSPSGDHILFRRIYDPLKSELWVMDFRGRNRQRIFLPKDGHIDDFRWSPQGDTIAVSVSTRESELSGGHSVLFVLSSSLEEPPRRIPLGAYRVNSLSFSPDGKTLALSLTLDQGSLPAMSDIWTVNVNNTELERLTPQDAFSENFPEWSPCGGYIAFLAGDSFEKIIWTMDSKGKGRRALNDEVNTSEPPLWGLEGESIFIPNTLGSVYKVSFPDGQAVEIAGRQISR